MRSVARSRQRGFIYLTTGANGAGKTLNTLKVVRERQLKENREVYYNGRFDMTADFGWKLFDFKDWQTLPDGALILLDECQNDLPPRAGSGSPPEPVRMLAEHRKRGFDFYLITQHPLNIDSYVRRLIGSPGWHRHLKRPFGGQLVSQLEWAAVNTTCEKTNAGKDANVSMVPFPKEVFNWYTSASLHTAKTKIPKQVYILGVLALVIPALIYGAFVALKPKVPNVVAVQAQKSLVVGSSAGAARPAQPAQSSEKKPMTTAEYVASFVPRIAGFPQSASRYDEVQTVTQSPKPAACIDGIKPGATSKTCGCWSQQATPLDVPRALCESIAKGGFFDDTVPIDKGSAVSSGSFAAVRNDRPVTMIAEAAPSALVGFPDSGYGLRSQSFLSGRNEAVRSVADKSQVPVSSSRLGN